MKKIILKSVLLLTVSAMLSACGDGHTEIPEYALGKSCYFTPGNDGQVIFSKNTTPQSVKTLGRDEMNRRIEIRGFNMEMDGKKFCLVSKSFAPVNALVAKKTYKLHALVKQADKENPYFKEGEYYSDTYYFVNLEDLINAVESFSSTPVTGNEESCFETSDYEEGVKTYRSKIIAVVNYVGSENGQRKEFASIYLECGAVVRLEGDNIDANDIGAMIDCVVDKNNDIVEYE